MSRTGERSNTHVEAYRVTEYYNKQVSQCENCAVEAKRPNHQSSEKRLVTPRIEPGM